MIYLFIMSLIYLVMISLIYFSKEKLETTDNRIYKNILIVNLIGLIIDMTQYVIIRNGCPEIIIHLVGKLFLVYIITWTLLFTEYVVNIGIKSGNTKHKELLTISKIVYVLFITAVFILPIDYYLEGIDSMYTMGPSVNAVYVAVTSYIVIMFISTISNLFIDKSNTKKQYFPLFIYIIFASIGMLIQFMNPFMLLTSPIETLATIVTYFFIENPDVKMINALNLAKSEAEKANKAKTDFLSSMSHEIRTPLNAIKGFSECIGSALTLDEAKENASDILEASDTLMEIVNGILDISKIEAGKLEIINTSYNLKDTLNSVIKLIKPRIVNKGLDFQVYIAPDIPEVLYGDQANVKKIILNLLTNAAKYTDTGFVKFDVNCVKHNNVCRIVASVEDSGRGIKAEKIGRLFTRFERFDEDKNTTIEGTGLGLAITKQLLDMMGGKIVVQSIYGKGSKFSIALDQVIDTNAVVKKESSDTENKIDVSSKTILIVDDNNLNLKVATKIISGYGPTIETVTSGLECLEKVKNNTYDLILLDDMMPKMSGVETLTELRKIDNFKTPVVVLTANAISGMKEKYLADGFDDYLAKPIEREELERVLNKLNGGEL